MKSRKMMLAFACACFTAVALCASVQSGDKKNPATTPSPRLDKKGSPDAGWMKRHDGFVEIAKKGGIDIVFLGDSITDGWRGKNGKAGWDKHFAGVNIANFGIGGDRTQHVLWRIQNGELDGVNPKGVVLMIGTNNTGSDSAEDIAAGVTAIVKTVQQKAPKAEILVLGVFPRGKMIPNPGNTKIIDINKMISKLDNSKEVTYRDIGEKFMKDGQIPGEIMPDYLHLSEKGYLIWGEAIGSFVQNVGKKK